MATSFRMNTGYNTTPLSLDALSAPLLSDFTGVETVLTEWHDYVSREQDGNRDWVEIGLPWVRITLYRVTRAEFALLMTYQGAVSITCLNQTANAYQTFNAVLQRPEINGDTAKWAADAIGGVADVILTFRDLVSQ